MVAQHSRFLERYFARLNKGAHKSLLPAKLAWLKAPGGQFYYWGDLPAYNRQEPVARVQAFFRESYFDGEDFKVLRDENVLDLPIPEHAAEGPATIDPSESDLDRWMGTQVDGKLLDLPEWAWNAIPDPTKTASVQKDPAPQT